MPAFQLSVGSHDLATVSCDERDVICVSVHGDMTVELFASAEISGGVYRAGHENGHLTWIDEHPLEPGANVELLFLESATDSHPGQTIDELYGYEERMSQGDLTIEGAMSELKQRPRLRARYQIQLSGTGTGPLVAQTRAGDHSFSFTVLWNWKHPRRARVALLSHCIDDLTNRTGGVRHADFQIEPGARIGLRVDA